MITCKFCNGWGWRAVTWKVIYYVLVPYGMITWNCCSGSEVRAVPGTIGHVLMPRWMVTSWMEPGLFLGQLHIFSFCIKRSFERVAMCRKPSCPCDRKTLLQPLLLKVNWMCCSGPGARAVSRIIWHFLKPLRVVIWTCCNGSGVRAVPEAVRYVQVQRQKVTRKFCNG